VNVAHQQRRVLACLRMAGRRALFLASIVVWALAACTDVRDFEGVWHGPRIGSSPVVTVGVGSNATATLTIVTVDDHGLSAGLAVDGVMAGSTFVSVPGAEADALAATTFTGSPLRVYFAFADVDDGDGQALVLVALFQSRRVDIRVLRGGNSPIYGVFTLQPV
jgi:hypothetical protein